MIAVVLFTTEIREARFEYNKVRLVRLHHSDYICLEHIILQPYIFLDTCVLFKI